MVESLLGVCVLWLVHAVVAGVPAIVAGMSGKRERWGYCLLLVVAPFGALVLAQEMWPTGGMSSYLVRLLLLTAIVFAAVGVEVWPRMRRAPAWVHLLLVLVATLGVIPLQLLVPALAD